MATSEKLVQSEKVCLLGIIYPPPVLHHCADHLPRRGCWCCGDACISAIGALISLKEHNLPRQYLPMDRLCTLDEHEA